ncbi:MAG: hypothetical protein II330_01600 [Clostridia bacterium]|nr:hypothetical protein [Clostridia bacterium]MBQ2255533.1 hypothetical protein [Clostridia bacterium]
MNKKTVISNVIVSVIVDLLFAGILIGAGVLVLLFPQIFGAVLSAAYALIGISLVLTTIPNLIGGIFSIKQKGGKFDLIFSIVTVAVGVVLAIYGIVSALIAIGISGIGLPVIISRIMSVIRFVVCGLIALFLIVLPLIRIIKAEKKFMQLKAELVKMTFGVLILVLLICGLVVYALNALIGISLIVVGVLAAFFALVILLVGLIGLKKADKKSPHVIEMDLNGDGIPDAIITKDE